MPRVVVKAHAKEVADGATSCPVDAFRKSPAGEYVIDQDICIDCGICQGSVPEGYIVEDSEANASDVAFNEENAENWDEI